MSFFKDKKVLVTGGTGQIGSFLVEKLVQNKADILILGRNYTRHPEIKELIDSKRIQFINCDISSEEETKRIKNELSGVGYLVHLSSAMEPVFSNFYKNARYDFELNVNGTINLLKNLKDIRNICFASSMAVYGAPAYNPVNEDCSTEPLNTYGVAKLTTEKLLKILSKSYGVPLSIIRYSSVYGPRNLSHRALPTFINNAILGKDLVINGDGSVLRDYIYVSDAVYGTINAMKYDKGGIFNIGFGKGCSIRTLAETIVKLAQSDSRIVYKRTKNDFDFIYDISKAQRELHYKPLVTLKDGLRHEITWHKTNL